MSKGKLEKFEELGKLSNTYQNFSWEKPALINSAGETVDMRGAWAEHFGNDNPITLELACGRGEYTVGLAARYPNRNFIAVDIKGNRIWAGAKQASDQGLRNAAFLRTDITLLDRFFEANEVDEFWITFPDPYLKKSKARKRLTAPRFLNLYQSISHKGAKVHLKTDEIRLYEFSLEVAGGMRLTVETSVLDIYREKELPLPELAIKTYYEGLHIAPGDQICYLRILLDQEGSPTR